MDTLNCQIIMQDHRIMKVTSGRFSNELINIQVLIRACKKVFFSFIYVKLNRKKKKTQKLLTMQVYKGVQDLHALQVAIQKLIICAAVFQLPNKEVKPPWSYGMSTNKALIMMYLSFQGLQRQLAACADLILKDQLIQNY